MSEPKNIEWVVTGSVKLNGATVIVHAANHREAVEKANAGKFIGGVEWDGAELADYDFHLAEANSSDD